MDNYIFIKKIEIKNFRAFSEQGKVYKIELGRHITCISGHNGIGKSTILAMLSNCGEIKKQDGVLLNGDKFAGEYSSIIKFDKENDSSGEKCSIYFHVPDDVKDSSGFKYPKVIDFRAAIQSGERYRLLPKKTHERPTESKIEWPTYYLGLSRLYPIGESENIDVVGLKADDEIKNEMFEAYSNILNTNINSMDSSFVSPTDAKKKKGVGIKTDKYGILSNSSGQDNLGQILITVFSFQNLKNTLEKKENYWYDGGILLIDEIDATLHPAAQNKLFKFLYKKSKELNLQIVFTTHSLSLLEYIGKSHELSELNTSCVIQYLRNDRGSIEIIKNPTIQAIKNDLMVTYTGILNSIKIDVLTEDDTARWFLDKILKSNNDKTSYELNFYDCDFGFTNIAKLIVGNVSFRECLIIFDPDISQSDNEQKVKDIIKKDPFFTFDKKDKYKRTLLTLPGNKAIETIIWEYIESLSSGNGLFFDHRAESMSLTKRSIEEYIKDKSLDMSDLKCQKNWFYDNKHICEIVVDYWIKDNKKIVDSFIEDLKFEYNKIAKLKGMKILE